MKEQVHHYQNCLEEELTSTFFIMLMEIQRDIKDLLYKSTSIHLQIGLGISNTK